MRKANKTALFLRFIILISFMYIDDKQTLDLLLISKDIYSYAKQQHQLDPAKYRILLQVAVNQQTAQSNGTQISIDLSMHVEVVYNTLRDLFNLGYVVKAGKGANGTTKLYQLSSVGRDVCKDIRLRMIEQLKLLDLK